jgi:hypothetical protein
MTSRNKNLILVHRGVEYEKDFDEIAAKVNSLDPTITIYHLPMTLDADLPVSAWQYPTLTVALNSHFRIPIRRGPILRNSPIEKLTQQEIFRNNNIATPPAMPFQFGMKLDPFLFGDFVILKPADLEATSTGQGIKVFRRERIENLGLADLPDRLLQRYLVQRFVHTGSFPSNFRATTFLGGVMTLEKFVGCSPTPPLTSPDHEIENADFVAKNDRAYSFVDDSSVLSFAERVAAAFPTIPLLGIDIIQSVSNKLYALEVNAGGNTWHYSSKMWEHHREKDPGYYLKMRTQFGAFDIAARRLTEATNNLAS